MTSKEALLKLCFRYLPTIDGMFLSIDKVDEELLKPIQNDLETLEMLLTCFKKDILDATNPVYYRGDNIIADSLKDKLGLIKLNELKRRFEDDK